jgi:hypothetical protein
LDDEDDDSGWEIIDDKEPKKMPRRKQRLEEDLDEDDAEEDEQPRPRRKSAVKRRARYDDDGDEDDDETEDWRPRRKKSGASKLLMVYLISAGVGLLLLLGGGLGAVFWYLNRDKNRGSDNEDLLAYIPADSELVIGLDVGTLMNNPKIATSVEDAARRNVRGNFLEQVKKETGLEFKDLFDHMILAYKFAPGQIGGRPTQVVIARSRVPFNQLRVRDAAKNAMAQRYQGKTYFKVDETGANFLYMPSDRVAILTDFSESQLQTLIANKGTTTALPAYTVSMIRSLEANQFWLTAPTEFLKQASQQGGFQGAGNGAVLPLEFKTLVDSLDKAKALSVSGAIEGAQFRINLAVRCLDSASAKKLATDMQAVWDRYVRPGLAFLGAVPGAAGLEKPLKDLTKDIHFGSQDDQAQISLTATMDTFDALVQQGKAMQQNAGGVQPQMGFPANRPPVGGQPGRIGGQPGRIGGKKGR